MSVQCKNCSRGKKIGTQIICYGWQNKGYVNGKKQRLCSIFIRRLVFK